MCVQLSDSDTRFLLILASLTHYSGESAFYSRIWVTHDWACLGSLELFAGRDVTIRSAMGHSRFELIGRGQDGLLFTRTVLKGWFVMYTWPAPVDLISKVILQPAASPHLFIAIWILAGRPRYKLEHLFRSGSDWEFLPNIHFTWIKSTLVR